MMENDISCPHGAPLHLCGWCDELARRQGESSPVSSGLRINDGDSRMLHAEQHEDCVEAKLISFGLNVVRFDLMWMSAEERRVVKAERVNDFETSVRRFAPDFLAELEAWRALFDAKGGEKYLKTGNHDFELDSLKAQLEWEQRLGCSCYMVFADMSCISASEALQVSFEGNYRGNGSATPFRLVKCSACKPLDSILTLTRGAKSAPTNVRARR